MDSTFKMYSEWIDAKKKQSVTVSQARPVEVNSGNRWHCPEVWGVKVNVDASVFPNARNFSVGMVAMDHLGSYVAGKVSCFPMAASVFEAEAIGIRQALSWIKDESFNIGQVVVESDSLLSVKAIQDDKVNLLEVGDIFEDCK